MKSEEKFSHDCYPFTSFKYQKRICVACDSFLFCGQQKNKLCASATKSHLQTYFKRHF